MIRRRIPVGDGLSLSAALYEGDARPPVFCLHGLTRNERDFEALAPRLARAGRRVVALSFRGRGPSDRDPDASRYQAATYRDDVLRAMDALDIPRAAFIGTSLGGIVSLLIEAAAPDRVAGIALNDIGVRIAPGIARILAYVTTPRPDAASLDEAAAQIRALNAVAFPDRDEDFWTRFALRTFRGDADGRWRLDYDPAIGAALLQAPPPLDLAGPFTRLQGKPCLLLRGALSDVLTPDIVDEMRALNPAFAYAEIAGVGHAPLLDEPEAVAAIDRFLEAAA